jgi:hypothetical protein
LVLNLQAMTANTTRESPVTCLVPPDTVAEVPGASEAFELGALAGSQLLIILRITAIVEQEALDVSVWGSADGKDWGAEPLFAYPQKFYREVAPAALDLRQKPEIEFLQVRWDVNRWGRGYPRPYFKFAVEIQPIESH